MRAETKLRTTDKIKWKAGSLNGSVKLIKHLQKGWQRGEREGINYQYQE